MVNASSSTKIQTTVNVSKMSLGALDKLSQDSGVSRSRLVDIAIRRFIRWGSNLNPRDLKVLSDYEVQELTSYHNHTSSIPPILDTSEESLVNLMPERALLHGGQVPIGLADEDVRVLRLYHEDRERLRKLLESEGDPSAAMLQTAPESHRGPNMGQPTNPRPGVASPARRGRPKGKR